MAETKGVAIEMAKEKEKRKQSSRAISIFLCESVVLTEDGPAQDLVKKRKPLFRGQFCGGVAGHKHADNDKEDLKQEEITGNW